MNTIALFVYEILCGLIWKSPTPLANHDLQKFRETLWNALSFSVVRPESLSLTDALCKVCLKVTQQFWKIYPDLTVFRFCRCILKRRHISR